MAKVTLYGRIMQDGKPKWVTVQISKNRKPTAVANAFGYYIQFSENGKQRQVSCNTTDVTVAFAAMRRKEAELIEGGSSVVPLACPMSMTPEIVAPEASQEGKITSGRTLQSAVDEWCEEIHANKSYKTWRAYSNSTTFFLESCSKTHVESVDRKDMLAFKLFLKGKIGRRSVYNNFLNVMCFLKWAKVKTEVVKEDWPPKPERDPEEYSDDEITALLNAAEPDERLLLNAFLCSGVRSGELANLTYGDINFDKTIWRVAEKEDWEAKTEGSYRNIPVPEWLTKKVEERAKALSATRTALVFPAPQGGVDTHLLDIVKRVACRAGLLTKVKGESRKYVGDLRIDDHKWRSTAITRWLREGNSVQDVMAWVGHKSLDTVLRYSAKINLEKAETQAKAHAPFAKFATVGD
jgi:integrase